MRWLRSMVVVGVFCQSGLSCVIARSETGALMDAPASTKRIQVAAHRGGLERALENSLPAFRDAMALRVEYLELDVHLTKDGQVVVIHDATLDRTTNGSGTIRSTDLKSLQQYQLRHPSSVPTDQRVPTLNEFLAALDHQVQLLLEIKVPDGGGHYRGIERAVLTLLESHQLLDRTIIMSFSLDTLERIRRIKPEARLGGLYGSSEAASGITVETFFDKLARAKAVFAGIDGNLITPDAVDKAHAKGIQVGVWTINNLELLERLVQMPIDIVITDRPAAVQSFLSDHGHREP